MIEILSKELHLETDSHSAIYNITDEVAQLIDTEGFTEGQALVFSVGSTSGISTLEFEPGLVDTDIRQMFDHFADYYKAYAHNQTWGDDNGAAHLRSFLTGTSLNIPFVNGKLCLGTWQQIVLVNFDTGRRQRKVIMQLTGKRGR